MKKIWLKIAALTAGVVIGAGAVGAIVLLHVTKFWYWLASGRDVSKKYGDYRNKVSTPGWNG